MVCMLLTPLLLAAAVQVHVRTASPVEKVVELINELKAKIDTDAAQEQKVYDKFACWCETTTKRKADNIVAGKATIGTTTTKILTLKGAIAVLATEISELEAKVQKNNEAMNKLTKIRERENGDYQEEKANMETSLGALHNGIEILSGAGTGGDMGLLSVAAKVRSAVLSSTSLTAMDAPKQKLLKAFLAEPADYYDQKAQAKASYSPASATIMGILKDMYDTFADNLQKANQEESNLQKAFEDVMAEKEKQNKHDKKTIATKEGQKAEKGEQLAQNEQTLENAQVQLADDEKFFDVTRTQCKAKSDSWDERCRSRTEELDGISKALGFLTSDEARATFAAATETRPQDTFGSAGTDVDFVQLKHSKAPRDVAYRALKTAYKQTKSLRLARMAAAVRSTTMGHFDSVISSIDEMVGALKAEGDEDVTQRDWCIKETAEQRATQSEQEYQIEGLEAKIARAKVHKSELEAKVAQTSQDQQDLAEAVTEAKRDRQAENAAYTQARSDDVTAIGLLQDATAAMSEFGKNNAALLQKEEPVFEVSEDQAPDADFSAGDNHAGATNGIVMLLTQITENLQNEVSLGDKAEDKAVAEHADFLAAAEKTDEQYDTELTNLGSAIADTDQAILDHNDAKDDTTAERDATVAYLKRITPNCNWINGAFEKRAAARKQEQDGLEKAKAVLSGAGDMGFLQRVQ